MDQRVTIEGVVEHSRRTDTGCILAFAPGNPAAFTVKLVLPLIRSEPAHPEVYYRRKRVRVTGVVQRFAGRVEMIVRSPSQITVLPDPASLADSPKDTVEAPMPATPAPTVATRLVSASAQRCEMGRARWRQLRPRMESALGAMTQCVRNDRLQCGAEASALYRALADLDAVQDVMDASCP